eukprot:836211-Rhodomonas_salina.2
MVDTRVQPQAGAGAVHVQAMRLYVQRQVTTPFSSAFCTARRVFFGAAAGAVLTGQYGATGA